jgi:glycosyltransferase involved in cell wall biosynthesis
MLKKALLKTSSLLYRVHRKAHTVVSEYLQEKKVSVAFTPYLLKTRSSGSPHKIIHVNGNFLVGGTTQLIVDIIEHLSDSYTHEIIVPDYPEPLPYQPVTIHKYALDELQALHDFLKKEQPVAVHIHYWVRQNTLYVGTAIWYATIFKICEELKIPVIQNVNVPTEPYDSPAVVHNVFVSNFVLDNYNTGRAPASVIYPGSNFQHFKNNDVEALPNNSIGMVYRLDKDKLNAEAIEIFIAVAKKKPDVQCHIVGGGYYLEHYQRRVAEEKLESNFYFTGFVSYDSLPGYYKKISIFVVPVHDESFGQVTPFAMSMGLCVAGYDTGAISEILGSTATLTEYGHVADLADSIVELINKPAKRIDIGRANQIRAHHKFSVEMMIKEYQSLYKKCVAVPASEAGGV